MSQVISDKEEKVIERKKSITRYLKFFLIPGWRDPEITEIEYNIGKTKSKRKLFRRVLTPLTIIGILMILFIAFCAVFSPWLTPYPLRLVTNPYLAMEEATAFAPPSPEHPLGTIIYGYDLLARLVWGSRTALTFGITSISIFAFCSFSDFGIFLKHELSISGTIWRSSPTSRQIFFTDLISSSLIFFSIIGIKLCRIDSSCISDKKYLAVCFELRVSFSAARLLSFICL